MMNIHQRLGLIKAWSDVGTADGTIANVQGRLFLNLDVADTTVEVCGGLAVCVPLQVGHATCTITQELE